MKIAVCDDEVFWQEQVCTIVDQFFQNLNRPCEITVFGCGEDLTQHSQYELIFMDMEMTGMSGLETAKRIRRTNEESRIVFLTSHEEIMKQTFEVQAYRFIEKCNCKKELADCLTAYMKEIAEKESVEVETREGSIFIKQKDIMWIEADHNGSIVWGSRTEINSSVFLSEWEERLDSHSFVRCHKKYIVNMKWVESIDDEVHLLNGYQLELSRRKKKEFKKQYMEYMFANM